MVLTRSETRPPSYEEKPMARCFVAFLSNPNIDMPFEEIARLAQSAANAILLEIGADLGDDGDDE